MRRSFSTPETPGAAQAAHSASSRSVQELTVPRRVTLPLAASTEIFPASSSAARSRACSILCLTSPTETFGGLDADLVRYAGYPNQVAHGAFRRYLFVVKSQFAFERNPAVFDNDFDSIARHRNVPVQCVDCGARDVRITPLGVPWEA